MRTLLLSLVLASSCAFAQSPLIKVLAGELDRNYTYLKEHGEPPPYFMAYEVTDNESDILVASQGSIDTQNHNHSRYLDTTIRVGTPAFDNYHLSGNRRVRFTSPTALPLADDAEAIQRTVWLATDRNYRGASQWFIQLQSNAKLRTDAADTSDDFSKEEAQAYENAPALVKFDATAWAERLKKLSAEFRQYPGALDSSVQLESRLLIQTLVNTEGARLLHGRPFARLIVYARGKSPDGMDLSTMESFETDDASKLPSDAEILAAVRKAGANLAGLLGAPLSDPYVGPAILSGRASGVLFHEIFGHRIEGHRQKD